MCIYTSVLPPGRRGDEHLFSICLGMILTPRLAWPKICAWQSCVMRWEVRPEVCKTCGPRCAPSLPQHMFYPKQLSNISAKHVVPGVPQVRPQMCFIRNGCTCGNPWGTVLQWQTRHSQAPIETPRGLTLRSPRPKVTSVLSPMTTTKLGCHHLSNINYVSNTASFVLCVFRRVKDHHNSLHYSQLLKKSCARRVDE